MAAIAPASRGRSSLFGLSGMDRTRQVVTIQAIVERVASKNDWHETRYGMGEVIHVR